jgi:hypothetical protein
MPRRATDAMREERLLSFERGVSPQPPREPAIQAWENSAARVWLAGNVCIIRRRDPRDDAHGRRLRRRWLACIEGQRVDRRGAPAHAPHRVTYKIMTTD